MPPRKALRRPAFAVAADILNAETALAKARARVDALEHRLARLQAEKEAERLRSVTRYDGLKHGDPVRLGAGRAADPKTLVHLFDYDDGAHAYAVCGRRFVNSTTPTTDPVTCQNCIRRAPT